MKKIFSGLAIIGVLALPAFAFADSITPGVQDVGGTITYWQGNSDTGSIYFGNCSNSLVINGITVDSKYQTIYDRYSGCTNSDTGSWAFNKGDLVVITQNNGNSPLNPILTGTLNVAAGYGIMTIPTSTAGTLTATIGSQLADSGTIDFLALAFGIPLSFFVFHGILGLFPSIRAHRKKYGEFG